MTISDLIPTLLPMVENLNTQFRFICFFILTAALIVRTGTGSKNISQLMRPILTNVFLCGLIATLPTWFNLIRDSFWNIAVTIRTQFTGSVDGTGAALLQLIQPPASGINWLDVGDSLMKAIQYALGWLIVWIGGMIQLPMMLIQYVMECLCYLFLPIALSLFAFEGTKGLAMRYVQQTLAVLAWPIGFAVVDLVGYSLLTSVTSAASAGALAVGAATEFTPASLVIGGIVAIWLILGSLVTPVIMQMLFCSGVPLSSSIGQAVQMGLAAAGYSQMAGSGSSSSSSTPSSPPSSSSGSGSSAPQSPPPNPPAPASPSLGWTPRAGLLTAPSASAPAMLVGPTGGGSNGIMQTPRGTVAVGQIADRIAPAQAQAFAGQSGTPFTQAFSNGSVATYQPAVSKVPPAPTFISPLTPDPMPS